MEAATAVSAGALIVTVGNALLILRLTRRTEQAQWTRGQRLPVYREVLATGIKAAGAEIGLRTAARMSAKSPGIVRIIEYETKARTEHSEAMNAFNHAASEAMLIGSPDVQDAAAKWLWMHTSVIADEPEGTTSEQWVEHMNAAADARGIFEAAARRDLGL